MAKHSRGVSLRGRAAGLGYWRDETPGDGGKRYLRHRVRRLGKRELRNLVTEALAVPESQESQD